MSGSPPGDFTLNLNRWHYRVEAALYACAIPFCAALAVRMSTINPASILLVAVLVVLVAGLVSSLQVLALRDPVLLIGTQGIFDKRVTRELVPWGKVRGIEAFPMYWSCVRIDVGNRRLSGIALNPWTYFGVFRQGIVAWDDIVIGPQGLAKTAGRGNAMLAAEIAAHAEAMRARYGRTSAAKV